MPLQPLPLSPPPTPFTPHRHSGSVGEYEIILEMCFPTDCIHYRLMLTQEFPASLLKEEICKRQREMKGEEGEKKERGDKEREDVYPIAATEQFSSERPQISLAGV